MNILLIPDKFKGSLTAREVISALKKGLLAFDPSFKIYEVIASDGGDGFLEALNESITLDFIETMSFDPLNRKIRSVYGIDRANQTAFIELANCSGMSLLSDKQKNALKTTTYGTGIQIRNAIENGVKNVFIGLGGSATNDGGIGMAVAMGYRILDNHNNDLEPVGENLQLITNIVKPSENIFKNIRFYAVNDVKNPLYGTNGAAFTYAKQKGADTTAIHRLDKGLRNLDSIVKSQLKINAAKIPGAGAAGGAAYGLKTFFNAEFLSGTDFILQQNGAIDLMKGNKIDLIITGEGKIDDQTSQGKLVNGIAKAGNQFNIPVIAICGKKDLVNTTLKDLGLEKILEISDNSKSLDFNMKNTRQLIQGTIRKYLEETIKI